MTTDEIVAIIRHKFPYTKTEELASELGVSYRTVCRLAAKNGVRKTEDFRKGLSSIAAIQRQRRYGCQTRQVFDEGIAAWMYKHYTTTPDKQAAEIFNVNDRTVRRWAARLGLRKDRDYIVTERAVRLGPTPEERFRTIALIQELFPDGRDQEAAELTGYSVHTIHQIAYSYGIRRNPERFRLKRQEQLAVIRELFPDGREKEAAELTGLSVSHIQLLARQNGIRRTEGYFRRLTEMRRERMAHARKYRHENER